MRKLSSISLAILILLAGMHITIATHFCGGEIAATKVSLAGIAASCGMESDKNTGASSEVIMLRLNFKLGS